MAVRNLVAEKGTLILYLLMFEQTRTIMIHFTAIILLVTKSSTVPATATDGLSQDKTVTPQANGSLSYGYHRC